MTTPAEYFNVKEPAAYGWPVSFRFHHKVGSWETRQIVSVDIPELVDDLEKTQTYGLELWKLLVAPATTTHLQLLWWETMAWKGGIAPSIMVAPFATGLLSGAAAPRQDTPVVVLNTRHGDDLAERRLYLAGARASWVQGRKLTATARDALDEWGFVAAMGLLRSATSSPAQLLLAFPELLPPTFENPNGVALRDVQNLVAMEYTAVAPQLSSVPWP